MKKALAVILCVLLISAVFVGCSNKMNDKTTASSTSTGATEQSTLPADTDSAMDDISEGVSEAITDASEAVSDAVTDANEAVSDIAD